VTGALPTKNLYEASGEVLPARSTDCTYKVCGPAVAGVMVRVAAPRRSL
jgi:hypothetical protein